MTSLRQTQKSLHRVAPVSPSSRTCSSCRSLPLLFSKGISSLVDQSRQHFSDRFSIMPTESSEDRPLLTCVSWYLSSPHPLYSCPGIVLHLPTDPAWNRQEVKGSYDLKQEDLESRLDVVLYSNLSSDRIHLPLPWFSFLLL